MIDIVETFAHDQVEIVIGDVRKLHDVTEASKDVDIVFHLAASTDALGPYEHHYGTNVIGTENVLQACIKNGVHALCYTSSSSVVIGGQLIKNGDEDRLSYPSSHLDHYSATKAIAEKKILEANGTKLADGELSTIALRPHIVFGPRDPYFLPRLIEKARAGGVTHIIGDGSNVTDFTYIDNIIYAHLLVAQKLLNDPSVVGGNAYFITNGEPRPFWDVVKLVLEGVACPGPNQSVSFRSAYLLASLVETLRNVGFSSFISPVVSRHTLVMMGVSMWFNHAKATKDFGYRPVVCLDEGLAISLRNIRKRDSFLVL